MAVKKRLALIEPVVIGVAPDRDNIKYSMEPTGRMDTLRCLLTTRLCLLRTNFPKTLIFYCGLMYKKMRRALDKDFTDPPGYPNYHPHG